MPSDYSEYYVGPRLVHHGGKCCGIKTLYALGINPRSKASKLDSVSLDRSDAVGDPVHCTQRFFTDAAPEESYRERVQRYVDFCKKHRPAGLIETCIVMDAPEWLNQACWAPILEELGFKQSLEWRNSNTGRLIRMYFLVYNETGQEGAECFVDDDPFEEEDEDGE